MLYYFIVALYVLTCGLLIITILLQQGKGGDIANAFGGGTSQAVFGARSGPTLLTPAPGFGAGPRPGGFGARSGATLLARAASVLAALFVILALSLTIIGQRGPSSVVGGGEGPAPGGPV